MLIQKIQRFTLSFVTTICIMGCALGIVLVDFYSAKNGFDEQHILPASYDYDTGVVTGRIMGVDYSFSVLSGYELEQISDAVYSFLPPQVRLLTDWLK